MTTKISCPNPRCQKTGTITHEGGNRYFCAGCGNGFGVPKLATERDWLTEATGDARLLPVGDAVARSRGLKETPRAPEKMRATASVSSGGGGGPGHFRHLGSGR